MKKILLAGVVGLLGAIASLAQTNDYSIRQVRDPVQLQTRLNTDFGILTNRVASPVINSTVTVWTAAAAANTNAAVPLQGIPVRVNGTNYVLKLYPLTGP